MQDRNDHSDWEQGFMLAIAAQSVKESEVSWTII
jgi:hypothetical protein